MHETQRGRAETSNQGVKKQPTTPTHLGTANRAEEGHLYHTIFRMIGSRNATCDTTTWRSPHASYHVVHTGPRHGAVLMIRFTVVLTMAHSPSSGARGSIIVGDSAGEKSTGGGGKR